LAFTHQPRGGVTVGDAIPIAFDDFSRTDEHAFERRRVCIGECVDSALVLRGENDVATEKSYTFDA